MLAEINRKIAESQHELKDLESSIDQRIFTSFESQKTYVYINREKKEVSATAILKEVPPQFSPTKLFEACIKTDQSTLTRYQETLQSIYKSYGLTEEEAGQETKKLYEKQVQEFEKEIARREDLRRRLEKLQTHRNVIDHLEDEDMLRYARAMQGDQAAFDELKNNEKTKALVNQFEEQQRENGRKALDLKTREETTVWNETMDLSFESHGNLSATVLKDKVVLDYRAFATDDPMRCFMKRDSKDHLVLGPDLAHEFWEAGIQNPFFDSSQFGPRLIRSGVEVLNTIKDFKKIIEFQILLNTPEFYDQLSTEEKEHLKGVFSKPANCLRMMSLVDDFYRKLRPDTSLKELLKEIFLPIVEKLHKPPENFFFKKVTITLDQNHVITGAWLKRDGMIRENNFKTDLEMIADYNAYSGH